MAPRRHRVRAALMAGLLIVTSLGTLVGWLGFRANESHLRAQQRGVFLAAARQGALNLTTISYTEVDADIKRILDSATGKFHDDFQNRSQPFVEVVKQAQSKSQGTVTEAGLESVHGDTAEALVAVAVTTSNAGAAQQQPRAWRMRISVQKMGEQAKVSNVEFVP
jgi:Mce-associated membrane protein